MAVKFERKNVSENYDMLTMDFEVADYLPQYEKKLKKIASSAQVQGFRVGKVPVQHIKNIYGKSVFYENLIEVVEGYLKDYIKTNEPLFEMMPNENNFSGVNHNQPSHVTMTWGFPTIPDFDIDFNNISINNYIINFTDAELNERYQDALKRFYIDIEKETIDNQEDNIEITIQYMIDNNSDAQANPLNFRTQLKNFDNAIQEQFMNQTKNYSFVSTLLACFGEDAKKRVGHQIYEQLDPNSSYKFIVEGIYTQDPPVLNAELFERMIGKPNINTEDECKEALRTELNKLHEQLTTNDSDDSFYKIIKEKYPYHIDHHVIENHLLQTEKNFADNNQADKETAINEFIKNLQNRLIFKKLQNKFEITITREQIENDIRERIMSQFGSFPNMGSYLENYIQSQIKNEEQVNNTYSSLLVRKIFDESKKLIKLSNTVVGFEEFNDILKKKNNP
ncbi:MAG: trigger factor [Alphaproteobacteria bacterium]|nr:trigger factor [Alphaproteobacteria bacterium]